MIHNSRHIFHSFPFSNSVSTEGKKIQHKKMKITTMKSLSILVLAFEGVSCFTPISARNGRFQTKITQQAAVVDLSSPMNITALNKGLCDEVMFKQGVQAIQEARSKQKEASEYQVAPDVLEDLRSQSIMDLKLLCSKRSIRYKGLEEHEEFVQAIVDNIKELKDFSVSGHLVPGVFNEISADILEQEMKSDKPLLLDVYATFCGPCKSVQPHLILCQM